MKYFLIAAAMCLVIFGGVLAKQAYDRDHSAPITMKKAEASFADFWSKLPVVDANGNKATSK